MQSESQTTFDTCNMNYSFIPKNITQVIFEMATHPGIKLVWQETLRWELYFPSDKLDLKMCIKMVKIMFNMMFFIKSFCIKIVQWQWLLTSNPFKVNLAYESPHIYIATNSNEILWCCQYFEFFFTSVLTGFAWASSWFLIESLLPLMTSAVATNSSWSAGSTSSSPTVNSWSTLHATNCTSLLIAVTVIVILRPATTIPSFLCTAGRKKCFVTCVNTPHWKINESPFILLTLYSNLYKAKKTINCLSFMNEIYKHQQHYYKLHNVSL